MYTEANGRIVVLEDGDDKIEVLNSTMCKCGHPLSSHSWIEWVPGTIHTSQCTACGFRGNEFVCRHFEAVQ